MEEIVDLVVYILDRNDQQLLNQDHVERLMPMSKQRSDHRSSSPLQSIDLLESFQVHVLEQTPVDDSSVQ